MSAPRMLVYPDGTDGVDRAFIDSLSAIPDGSIVEGIVAVVSYVEQSGEHRWTPYVVSDVPLMSMFGLLELAKLRIAADVFTPASPTESEE